MTLDLDQLEALAKAATPGPYEVQTHYGEERLVDEMTDHTFSCVRQEGGSFEDDIAHFHSEDCPGIDDEANARYFAALDPESILALIAEVRALRKDRERLDSGCIMTHERNEFGEEYKCERRGNDLRKMIDEAIAARAKEPK